MKTRIFAALTIALLWAAAPVGAQTPLKDTYGGSGQVVSDVGSVGSQKPAAPKGSTSPSVDDTNVKAGIPAAPAVKRVSASAAPSGNKAIRKAGGPSLPFTGFDVLLLLAAGAVLLSTGIAMRRLVRPPA